MANTTATVFEYLPNMEVYDEQSFKSLLALQEDYAKKSFTAADVEHALQANPCSLWDFAALLSPAAAAYLEPMAERAQQHTQHWFGNAVRLFTPLYIANYCENACTYCGFNCQNKIQRGKLSLSDIRQEAETIAKTGLQELLLLTGESRAASNIPYIASAVAILKEYFRDIGLEIYPLNTNEYQTLHDAGADAVSVYQETYDPQLYAAVHPHGPKRCMPYRFNALERALSAGMRAVSFGALLGLGAFRQDAFATGAHAWLVQKKFPHAELSFSFPRIRPCAGQEQLHNPVSERKLLQVMLAFRLFMPFAGITVSTRETARFRNHAVRLCATRLSAGVQVGVGGHAASQKGDPQFTIYDSRSVTEMQSMLQAQKLQPVFLDAVPL